MTTPIAETLDGAANLIEPPENWWPGGSDDYPLGKLCAQIAREKGV